MNATDMPALTGTDKQIGWAAAIRQQFIDDIDRLAREGRATMEKRGMLGDPRYIAFTAGWNAELNDILTNTAAAWWIDRRSSSELTTRVKKAAMAARDAG